LKNADERYTTRINRSAFVERQEIAEKESTGKAG
jgi:hypothetical protein